MKDHNHVIRPSGKQFSMYSHGIRHNHLRLSKPKPCQSTLQCLSFSPSQLKRALHPQAGRGVEGGLVASVVPSPFRKSSDPSCSVRSSISYATSEDLFTVSISASISFNRLTTPVISSSPASASSNKVNSALKMPHRSIHQSLSHKLQEGRRERPILHHISKRAETILEQSIYRTIRTFSWIPHLVKSFQVPLFEMSASFH
jgi:hypothetical protein